MNAEDFICDNGDFDWNALIEADIFDEDIVMNVLSMPF